MESFISLTKEIEQLYGNEVHPLFSMEGSAMLSNDLEHAGSLIVGFEIESLDNLFNTCELVTTQVKKILIETYILAHRTGGINNLAHGNLLDHIVKDLVMAAYPNDVIEYHIGGEDRQEQIFTFARIAMNTAASLRNDIYVGWIGNSLIGGRFD